MQKRLDEFYERVAENYLLTCGKETTEEAGKNQIEIAEPLETADEMPELQ